MKEWERKRLVRKERVEKKAKRKKNWGEEEKKEEADKEKIVWKRKKTMVKKENFTYLTS